MFGNESVIVQEAARIHDAYHWCDARIEFTYIEMPTANDIPQHTMLTFDDTAIFTAGGTRKFTWLSTDNTPEFNHLKIFNTQIKTECMYPV